MHPRAHRTCRESPPNKPLQLTPNSMAVSGLVVSGVNQGRLAGPRRRCLGSAERQAVRRPRSESSPLACSPAFPFVLATLQYRVRGVGPRGGSRVVLVSELSPGPARARLVVGGGSGRRSGHCLRSGLGAEESRRLVVALVRARGAVCWARGGARPGAQRARAAGAWAGRGRGRVELGRRAGGLHGSAGAGCSGWWKRGA